MSDDDNKNRSTGSDSDSEHWSADLSPNDLAIDGLLREHARMQAVPDRELLDDLEVALDGVDAEHAIEMAVSGGSAELDTDSEDNVIRPKRFWASFPVWGGTALAACFAMMLVVKNAGDMPAPGGLEAVSDSDAKAPPPVISAAVVAEDASPDSSVLNGAPAGSSQGVAGRSDQVAAATSPKSFSLLEEESKKSESAWRSVDPSTPRETSGTEMVRPSVREEQSELGLGDSEESLLKDLVLEGETHQEGLTSAQEARQMLVPEANMAAERVDRAKLVEGGLVENAPEPRLTPAPTQMPPRVAPPSVPKTAPDSIPVPEPAFLGSTSVTRNEKEADKNAGGGGGSEGPVGNIRGRAGSDAFRAAPTLSKPAPKTKQSLPTSGTRFWSDGAQDRESELKRASNASPRKKHLLQPSAATPSSEAYGALVDNVFKSALDQPLSTFSIDVDTASYSNIRRMIGDGQKVPADSVRIEEMINYFSYDYVEPQNEHPFSVNLEVASSPWSETNRIVRIGLKGLEIDQDERPSANLVFLLDVSGSMNSHDKLPLVKRAMETLTEGLNGDDTVGIVVYAGSQGIALKPTDGGRKEQIIKAIRELRSGGSTNGEGGIKLAYKMAAEHFVDGGINRVVLCTDGDFNVGTSNTSELVDLVKKKAKSGVFLSVCGFGTGNLNDKMLEAITNDGNGNYYYIDSANEAEKVFCDDLAGTLIAIAKDVKIQVEFNPAKVSEYRLIGYANRMLRNRDFNDDMIDAGEIGSGHTVTVLYEIVPFGATSKAPEGTTLRYQKPAPDPVLPEGVVDSPELMTVKLRYKQPDGDKSKLIEVPLIDAGTELEEASADFKFATSVAGFGMLLRDSEAAGDADRGLIIQLAKSGRGKDKEGRRKEFIELVRKAKL